jgi:hypothetical protein
LFSFAKAKNISVHRAKEILDIDILFHLPISTKAFNQLLSLAQELDDIPTNIMISVISGFMLGVLFILCNKALHAPNW